MVTFINVDLEKAEQFQPKLAAMYKDLGIASTQNRRQCPKVGVDNLAHLPGRRCDTLADIEQKVGGESLRLSAASAATYDRREWRAFSRTQRLYRLASTAKALSKILVSLRHHVRGVIYPHDDRHEDTRIAQFLVTEKSSAEADPETVGKTGLDARRPVLATFGVTAGWGVLVYAGSIDTIAAIVHRHRCNQLLAVVALALVTTLLVNTEARGALRLVTLLPMLFVTATAP